MEKLMNAWLWASVILPAAFGAMFLFATAQVLQQMPAAGLTHQVAIRQLVYAAVLAWAILKAPRPVVAVLLAGRGLTDLGDGLDTMMLGGFSGPALFPLIAAAISFAVAYALYRRQPEPAPT